MLLDVENQYSKSQAVAGAAFSGDLINHGVAKTGLGAGEPMAVMVSLPVVTTAVNWTVTLQTSVDAAFTAPVTLASKVILAADVVVGAREYIALNPDYKALQYTRLSYTGAVDLTVDAYLIPQSMQDQYESFANNTTIS
jgi:hypothetical protein